MFLFIKLTKFGRIGFQASLTEPFQKKTGPSSLQTARLGDLRLQLDAEARISKQFLIGK